MTRITCIIICLLSLNANAFSFDDISNKIADFLGSFLDKKKTSIVVDQIEMPKIPQVNTSATSTDTYKKTGVIFSQGKKFKNLSINKKRQYQLSFLKELFKCTKGDPVSESTLVDYLNILEQGGSREGIFRAIVLDSRYSQLESYPPEISEKLYEYIINLSSKFLNKNYTKDQLIRFNKYTLKRIFIEKLLGILDTYAFKTQPESIYAWYAHLSAQVSHYKIWNNKTRQNTSLKYHLNWAKNVPFEHIKSEVIIKVSSVIDYLATLK